MSVFEAVHSTDCEHKATPRNDMNVRCKMRPIIIIFFFHAYLCNRNVGALGSYSKVLQNDAKIMKTSLEYDVIYFIQHRKETQKSAVNRICFVFIERRRKKSKLFNYMWSKGSLVCAGRVFPVLLDC